MSKKVKFHQNQQGVYTDHNDVQMHVEKAFDNLVYDAVTPQARYAGCLVEQATATSVSVAVGRLYKEGRVYTHEDAAYTIDFFSSLPVSTEKIVAIVLSGSTIETDNEQRKFLVDATKRATQVQTVPTTVHRAATIGTQAGTEAATPAKPTVSSDLVVVAWVTLNTTGVASIEMNTDAALESIQNNDARLIELEDWRDEAGNRLDTLAADISGISEATSEAANEGLMLQIAADVARTKELLEIEDSYADYGADRYLDSGESDTDHVNFLAKVEEGVRFSSEAEDEFALELFNPIDPTVIVSNGFLLPLYTNKRRLTVQGYTQKLSINQYTSQTLDFKRRSISRRRVRYGQQFAVCTNSHWWQSGRYDPVRRIFFKDGDTFEISNDPRGGKFFRARKFWKDTFRKTYWKRIVTTSSVNGSVIAQTFLNSQVGWMTAFHLYLREVGPSGDITILLCETKDGKPDPDAVIGTATLAKADMIVGWNEVAWPATLLEPGQRYGFILSTQGSHHVGLAQGSRYAQGTLFYSTDGAFFQGDLTKDLMFAIDCAEFAYNRVEVEMDALSLSGGLTDIDLLLDAGVPDGTDLSFEVQPGGSGVWYPLQEVADGNTALVGLPALCKFRAVFTGSPDAHPGINLVTSRMNISRPRTTFKHISEAVTFAGTTQSVKVTVLLENYYETNHNLTCVIDDVTNASAAIAPATTTDVDLGPDPLGDDANHKRIRRTFEWTATELPVATGEIVITLDGATSSALDIFHVSERVHLAF